MTRIKGYLLTGLLFIGTVFIGQGQDSIAKNSVSQTILSRELLDETVFENMAFEGAAGGGTISWNLNYKSLDLLRNGQLIIKYNTKIGEKRNKGGYANSDWEYTVPFSAELTSFEIDDLTDAESYVFKIGFVKEGDIKKGIKDTDQMVWSDSVKGKTERSWGIMKFLIILGSLGLFIYGMKVMSEGLQQTAGARLRNWLRSMTSNRFKGVLTGFGITSIVQSSSVTTVMTVSFVNAGLMNLRESAGVMMGANIGTTITAWLVLIFGFKVDISSYSFVLFALVFPLLFINRGKAKTFAHSIIGFSLLFMGLGALKDAVPNVDAGSDIVMFFAQYKDAGMLSTILFVCLGAIVTIIIQSSSAAMTLTMALVAKDIIPFEVASAMILGENIGTTITAELAAMVANVHAKRSARIHSLFNVIGVTWVVLIFPFFLDLVGYTITKISGTPFDPTDANMANEGLAVLHTSFNAINVLLLIWFVPQLVRIAERTVKSKGGSDEEYHLEFIGTSILSSPDISIYEAKKEVMKFGTITAKMSTMTRSLLFEKDGKAKEAIMARIKKFEEITDRIEIEVAQYLNKVSEVELTQENSKEIRALNSITNDLERVGDIFFQISKGIERKDRDKAWFSPEQRQSLLEMLDLVDNAFEVMNSNLSLDSEKVSLVEADSMEDKINQKRNELRNAHLANMESPEYNIKSGMIYNDLFSSLEKVGDHLINVTEALIGKI
jgi:phosphate:Na+ symporter